MRQIDFLEIKGIKVGQTQDSEAATGCTVIISEEGATVGVDVRGGAPGTRETDLLNPVNLVQKAHAILLAGGSAFGLDAAAGVMQYLEENNIGFDVQVTRVPIVCGAALFDLTIGDHRVRPDKAMGYQACLNASSDLLQEGNVGAGMGCTVGKILGVDQAMKSGIGTASKQVGDRIIVAAIVAVNAFGDVIDPSSGQIVAGVRTLQGESVKIGSPGYFADTLRVMESLVERPGMGFASRESTVIGVVATNARLNKEQINKVAQMAQDGLARTVRPAHTMLDGDTIFALATGEHQADVNIVGAFAAEVVAQAILRAVRAAQPAGGLPVASEFQRTWRA